MCQLPNNQKLRHILEQTLMNYFRYIQLYNLCYFLWSDGRKTTLGSNGAKEEGRERGEKSCLSRVGDERRKKEKLFSPEH